MKAVILAAGKGSRMRPETFDTPKPLLLINQKTIIERILNSLPDEIDKIIIVVDYLKEKIQEFLGDKYGNREILYAVQGKEKGTFGALLSAKDFLDNKEKFLVLNADDINDKEELSQYLKHPRSFGIQKMIMPNYYNVKTENNFIIGFEKQNDFQKENGAMIGTGVYLLDNKIFNHPGVSVFGGELGLPQTIFAQKDEFPITSIETTKWFPINTIEDLERARSFFA